MEILRSLPKFEPLTPKQIYYLNQTTKCDTLSTLIEVAKKAKQFVIETKYGYKDAYPTLIQILFAHRFTLFIIILDSKHLPWTNRYLHKNIESLFSVILSPYNEIQSWNDVTMDLKIFFDYALFKFHDIDRIHVVGIEKQFRQWVQSQFGNTRSNNVLVEYWTLQMAISFAFQEYLDITLSSSYDWDIGLFLEFDENYVEELIQRDTFVCDVQSGHRHRSIHSEYAVLECLAVNRIAVLFQNEWTLKNAETFLKKYYTHC